MRRVLQVDRKTHRVTLFLREALTELLCQSVKRNPEAFLDVPKGEMDAEKESPHGVTSTPATDQKSNVVLEDQEGTSSANPLPKPPPKDNMSCMSVPMEVTTIKTFMDRWFTIKQGMWTNEAVNAELFKIDLPVDVLQNETFRRSPNYAVLSRESYWKCNMRVKILVNANARQYGQLQCRFYYMAYADENFALRNNIYTGSQQPHCLITASSSNSGELFIPFEFVYPIMCVTKGAETWEVRKNIESFANLGTLVCSVVVPLTVAETTPQKVSYSVLIAFEDNEVAGKVDTSLINYSKASAEMFNVASMFALSEIASRLDSNRDNPTLSGVGAPVIPVNAGSWCAGTGIPEWTNVLRLNPRNSTPYPTNRVPDLDEMKVDFVKGIYSMIGYCTWDAQNNVGTQLWETDAAPLMRFSRYPVITYKEQNCYAVPAVGVLSSMFAWWRGDLELRIDVVGATELTGRILVCYVPRYYHSITIEQAYNCDHTIFDLQKNRQFNYRIPFVSDRMFWERVRTLNKTCMDKFVAPTIFGEKFTDLKDYCRRYQLYAYISASNHLTLEGLKHTIMYKFPACPQGLDLKTLQNHKIDEYWNRTREGPIPLILSAYRYFVGSLRFRVAADLVNTQVKPRNCKVFVQHRPDISPQSLKMQFRSDTIVGTDDVELPGYASYYQFDDINNIICFEVPFYLPTVRSLLQRPKSTEYISRWSSLGEIAIGYSMDLSSESKFTTEIYYSLGDDARACVFQGFPPMIDITRIQPSVLPAKKEIERPLSVQSEFENLCLNEDEEPQGEMAISDYLPFATTNKALEKVSEIDVNEINKTVKNTNSFLQDIKDTITNNVPTFSSLKDKLSKYTSMIINVVTNFIHCLLNFNLRSVVVAIISIFTQIKLMTIDFTSSMVDSLFNLFQKVTSKERKEEVQVPTGEMSDYVDLDAMQRDDQNYTAAYVSTLVAGIAATLALTPKISGSNWKSICYLVMDGLKSFAMTANHLFTFIKNNLICIQKIGNWLVDDSPTLHDIKFLENTQTDIYQWAVEAIKLTNPWHENKLFTSVKEASRVHLLCAKGNLILMNITQNWLPQNQYRVLEKLLDNLSKLRDRLVRAHMAPPVRWEPFVYELTGPTGTGKSSLLNIIPYELLKATSTPVHGEVIFHRSLGNAYWNNCRNQPVCSIDEKFPIAKPGFDDVQIAELMQLKSRCVFNPPMADIPDKNLRYNPLIVQYASNNPFPQLTGILDPHAINRRRDALYRVEFTEAIVRQYRGRGIAPTMDRLTYAERRNFACLQFRYCEDPVREQSPWSAPMNYDRFLQHICRQWREYYRREQVQFNQHMARAMAMDTPANIKNFDSDWIDQTGSLEVDSVIQELQNELQALRLIQKDKKEKGYSLSIWKLLSRLFGGETDLDDKELEKRVKELRSKINETIHGQMAGDDSTSEKTIHEHLDDLRFRSILKGIAQKKFKCVHNCLIDLHEVPFYGTINYEKDLNSWHFDKEIFTTILPIANPPPGVEFLPSAYTREPVKIAKDELELCDLLKRHDLVIFGQEYYIKNSPCGSVNDCVWKDEAIRRNFYNLFKTHNETLKMKLQNGLFTHLGTSIPDEYLKMLTSSMHSDTPEGYLLRETKKVGFLKHLWNELREKFMSIEWKKWFQRLALLIGVFFFLGALWKLWGFVYTPHTAAAVADATAIENLGMAASFGTAVAMRPQAEAFSSGDYKTGSVKKPTPRNLAVRDLSSKPGGEMYTHVYQNLRKAIKRNSFFLTMFDDTGKIIMGRCLGICGKYALMVDHYFEAFQNFKLKYVTDSMHYIPLQTSQTTAVNINFNELNYQKFSGSSLGLLELPVRIPAFKDIRSLIAPLNTHRWTNGQGLIVEMSADERSNIVQNECTVEYKLEPTIHCAGNDLFGDFDTGTAYSYNNFHGAGKCGSILTNASVLTPILGMHVAGTSTRGFAESIYREMFEHLEAQKTYSSEVSRGEGYDSNWYIDAQVVGMGAVALHFSHRANEKTRIQKSFVQRQKDPNFPVYTDISVLSPKDKRLEKSFSPLLEGCKFHGLPLKPFNKEHLEIAINDLENLILAKCKPVRPNPGLLSVLDVCRGIDGVWGYDSLEWNSSEGFPFVSDRPSDAHDKRWMFEFDAQGQCTGCNSVLREELERKWNLRLEGTIPETVFTDCLKDCTVDLEKVLEPGKTRIFSISPVDFTIQQRQCTLDFSNSYMHNRLDLEHAVGINPVSIEWAELTTKLLLKGNSFATGDYSKFGDTIPAEFIHAFFRVVIKWYKFYGELTEEHQKQLEIFAHEISNSTHLMFNFLYRVVCGQPSGNSLTVIINSFANSLYVRLAWLHIMQNTSFNSLEDLHHYVQWFSYGDDLILALSDKVKEQFNSQSLCDFFALHDLKFTNADKGLTITKYTNLSKATFLKRGFTLHPYRKIPQIILAPLEHKSIYDTVNWVNKENNFLSEPDCAWFKEMSVQVCADALRNAFCSGPQYYEEFRIKLQNFWLKHRVNFVSPTWKQLDERVFDLGENITQYIKFNHQKSL